MRRVYSVIAGIISGGIVVQAASISLGLGGMLSYVEDGGVVDKALVEGGQQAYTGDVGFLIHEHVGWVVIPIAAIALLIVSFFVKARGARMWAAIVFGLVALQVVLGYSIADTPYAALFHGANALAVLLASVSAALLVRRSKRSGVEEATSDAVAA